jgi:Leu/Phe-tRNA-protein transferase
MTFFAWLQETPFAHWVASDPSLLAYPTILTLHTNLRNDRKGSPVNQERDSGLDQRFLATCHSTSRNTGRRWITSM